MEPQTKTEQSIPTFIYNENRIVRTGFVTYDELVSRWTYEGVLIPIICLKCDKLKLKCWCFNESVPGHIARHSIICRKCFKKFNT